ncbi:putative membrane protein YphA (DoxX/SURF4 family) [Anseongella ginsenosidimutans]|uniref:Putative membrane protein YphA (DoxX/SURF4 family) n=1 Tax=Anseongella ginsenosidimutans TaxID=496056 RepID=A0A4R3KX91_9SPHI|nr:BT_3928 family protein [Anseongella ginsenosidimutans]TCS90447.1 putative membrane protein YphA (DoxX/SURF4 family) [Anseongella ginsenosidimutans]
MRLLTWICRIPVGLLFIFSGLIKANDPMGFGFKLEEYFVVFGIEWLSPLAVSLSILICSLEIVLGVAVLLGARIRLTAWGLLLLILFFTWLTFYSAWFNKVTDCGCFGDAIKLTPWQSFTKDLILLALILPIFLYRRRIQPVFSKTGSNLALLLAAVLSLGFGLYTYFYLPVVDLLPYKVGNHLPSLMTMPPDAEPDVFKVIYTLKNKKTGELREMDDKEYLSTKIWENPDWEYVKASDPILVKKGYTPPIHDLSISNADGVAFTDELLNNPFYNLVIVMYDLRKTDRGAQPELNAIVKKAQDYNIRSVGLTAASEQATRAFISETGALYEFFYCDATPLKSMVRSNPGLLLLKDGTVIAKWSHRELPDPEELERLYFAD